MSLVNPDELSGSMVTLGLVIERPNAMAKEVGQEVSKRFLRARFSASTAHGALPRLAERRRDKIPCVELTDEGPKKSEDRYRATQHGVKVFRAWMYDDLDDGGHSIGQPALREAMLGRVELAQVRDLPRLIQMARIEAKASADLFESAALKLRHHLGSRGDPLDFERKIREVLLYVDPLHWSVRSERYRDIANRLEDIKHQADTAGVEFGGG